MRGHPGDTAVEPFEIVSVPSPGDDLCVSVRGELDAHTAGHLRLHVEEAMQGSPHLRGLRLIADGCTFIDSGALRVLLELDLHLSERGGNVVIVDPSPVVLNVLEITELLKRFGLER